MLIDSSLIEELESESNHNKLIYFYCPKCRNRAWLDKDHKIHNDDSGVDHIEIQGVAVIEDAIEFVEEDHFMTLIDTPNVWKQSQEGRCKQDFGPKVNFLAKKASVGDFAGFPLFAKNILRRFQTQHHDLLGDFVPVEFCILEYAPERGSYIRPHYDDTWIWGDRLVTLNLGSGTILRLTREFNIPPYEIAIDMPPRSLVVIYGDARYNWHHSIKRFDIKSRRIAMTWREFSQEIVADQQWSGFVKDVLSIANKTLN